MNNRIPVGSKAPIHPDTAIGLKTRREAIKTFLPGAFFLSLSLLEKDLLKSQHHNPPKTTNKKQKTEKVINAEDINQMLAVGIPMLSGAGLLSYAWAQIILNVENKKKLIPQLDKLLPTIHQDFMNALEVYENISFTAEIDAGSIRNNPWGKFSHPEKKEQIYNNLEIIIQYGTDEFAEVADQIYKKLKSFEKQEAELKKPL